MYKTYVSKLRTKLDKKKSMSFSNSLIEDYWKEEKFVFNLNHSGKKELCKSCKVDFIDGNKEICLKCENHINIGSILPKLKYIEITDSSEAHIKILSNYGVKLHKDVPGESENFIYNINDSKIYPKLSNKFKFIANNVPMDNHKTISFDELGKKSIGTDKLAYLKADVDNLGSIFSLGFNKDVEGKMINKNNISRTTTLSRMLDIFFTGRISEIIKKKYENCYVVYSGGDDLFIIGPWSEIIDFSIYMEEEFRSFVGNNANITISAGISMANVSTPVSKVADYVEGELEESKGRIVKGEEYGKNHVTIFNRTMKWQDFKKAIDDGKKLTKWIKEGLMTHGDLWRLKEYDELFQDFYINGNVQGLKYKPFLAYHIGKKKKSNKDVREVVNWQESLFDMANPSLINLGVAMEYAVMASKGR
ncbi:MAG: type III-A CRISPR-associated protein Cas10/Csm1 [Anaeromicrobium sp.]|nr:type III-A CRISPR-associated protein Cas10/Csm1 [Anaeromicrobium sp.]MCT4593246.1 type III-A CRISPR-associated protein Cas10/Csm1 [Anaeromicrobium sp.]